MSKKSKKKELEKFRFISYSFFILFTLIAWIFLVTDSKDLQFIVQPSFTIAILLFLIWLVLTDISSKW